MTEESIPQDDYNPTIKDWIDEGGLPAQLNVYDSTGKIIKSTGMVFVTGLPDGVYRATLTISPTPNIGLLLVGTHSLLVITDGRKKSNWLKGAYDGFKS